MRTETENEGIVAYFEDTNWEDNVFYQDSVFDIIDIVELELTDKSQFARIDKFFVTDSLLIIGDRSQDKILKFNRQGKFLGTIGTKGKGPNEYHVFMNIAYDKASDCLYITNGRKVLIHDLKTDEVSEIRTDFAFADFRKIGDSFWGYAPWGPIEGIDSLVNIIQVADNWKDVMSTHLPGNMRDSGLYGNHFFDYDNQYFFAYGHNTQVYQIIDGEVKPFFRLENLISSERYEELSGKEMSRDEYAKATTSSKYYTKIGDLAVSDDLIFFGFSQIVPNGKSTGVYTMYYDRKTAVPYIFRTHYSDKYSSDLAILAVDKKQYFS